MELKKANRNVPDNQRGLSACIKCKLVLTLNQWGKQECCPNCQQEPPESTPEFNGFISMMFPKESWVAKWNGMSQKIPGIYAMELIGYEEEDMGYREGAGNEDYDNEDENFIVRDDEVE